TNRFWDFGDGLTTNTTATNFTHTYASAGTNTVRLTVSGPVGTNLLSRASYIVVTNLPPNLALNPTNLDFGSVSIGQTGSQSFQLINNGGLTLTGSVSTTLPFAIQSGTPYSVAPGQTGIVTVTFSPTNPASFSNAVVFISNGGNRTNAVTGIGSTPPQLGILPASLDFGIADVDLGQTNQASFVVTNR